MKTIGELKHSDGSDFAKAVLLNDPDQAYKILSKLTNDVYFPTENTSTAWIDLAVKEKKYYAVYAQSETATWPKLCISIEIEPTDFLTQEYSYYQQFFNAN